MSTLVRLPSGRRVIFSDSSRTRQQFLSGCECDSRMGEIAVAKLNKENTVSAAKSAASGAATGSAFGPIGTAIGAVLGAAVALLGSKKDRDKLAFYEYRKVYGQNPGRAYDEAAFEIAWQGFNELAWDSWMANLTIDLLDKTPAQNPYGARNLPHWFANKVIDAVCKGVITGKESAETVFNTVIWPVISKYFPPNQNYEHPYDRQIMVDWIDRILANQPIGETNRNSRQAHIIPGELIPKLCPPPAVAQSVPVVPPSSSAVVPVPLPAPVPSTPTPVQTTTVPIVQTPQVSPPVLSSGTSADQLQSLISQLTQQGLNQQQVFTAALSALNKSGVTITPQVQTAVADQVKNSGTPTWLIPAGVGALGLVALLMMRKRRAR